MPWWDHEELKQPEYRSERYKRTFPQEYEHMNNKPWQMHKDNSLGPDGKLKPQPRAVWATGTPQPIPRDEPPKPEVVDQSRPDKFFVLVSGADSYEFGVVESFSDVEDALEFAEEQREEYLAAVGDGEPIVTIVYGREVKVKRSGYVIDRD